jgi:two-component system sensor histidine kinase UhpB
MPASNPPLVLIVDDNRDNLDLLEIVIGELKVKLIRALSGAEALQKTKRLRLALAIIDVRMPEMDGYELADRLNRERPGEKVPVIFLTANHSDEIEIRKGYGSGAVDYLFKPVNPQILRCKIGVFLDLFRQNNTIIRDAAMLKRSADQMSKVIAALKTSNERYESYVNNAPDGVFITDVGGRFLELNKALCRITGFRKDELLNIKLTDLVPEENFSKGLAKFVKGLRSGKIKSELQFRHKNGSMRWWTLEAVSLSRNRFLYFTKDIPNHKRVMEALWDTDLQMGRIIKGANAGAMEWNMQSGETLFNEEFARILGYSHDELEEIMVNSGGWAPDELFFHPDEKVKTLEKLENHFSGKLPFYDHELRIKHKKGHWMWVNDRARVITRTAEGKPLIMSGTRMDITERKIAEKEKSELEQLQRLNQYTEKARENERAAISRELHDDLGQALTAVKIDLGMIRNSISDLEVVSEINKVTALVSDTIKTVQRITSNLRPDIIYDLGLETAIEWYTREFSERYGKEVTLELTPSVSFSSEDALTLFRIMQESLTNIARHSKASRVKIKLYREGDHVIFSISDNGIGITEKQRNAKNSFGIIGMHERATSLQADFEVSRKKGGGTLITLLIPLKHQQL